MFYSTGFPLVRPLSSTFSATRDASPALFEGFLGTMGLSDFPPPCIAVVLNRFTARTSSPLPVEAGRRDLPVPAREACIRARGLRPRGAEAALANSETAPCCLPQMRERRRPSDSFSRLNSPARIPPVNASRTPCGRLAHDSGLSGSLLLSHVGLAPTTSRQS